MAEEKFTLTKIEIDMRELANKLAATSRPQTTAPKLLRYLLEDERERRAQADKDVAALWRQIREKEAANQVATSRK